MLEQVSKDRTVPRNIRLKCEESIKILQNDKEELAIRINTVISMLDDVSNDPNIPMYTRTQIWNIVSTLESEQK
jgi:uncharacterized protein (UPF0147 family)